MTESNRKQQTLALVLSMVIFGTIGICRRGLPLPSDVIAFTRGILGSVFLVLAMKASCRSLSFTAVKGSLPFLIISGAMIGFNWILLFEAYNYTTVAVATLCYYMQPVIVLLVSPILFRERITPRKAVCAAVAVYGMVLVSGAGSAGAAGSAGLQSGNTRGVLLGLGAAALYAAVVLLNKKLKDVPVYEKTTVQLFMAAAALIPYMMAQGTLHTYQLGTWQIILLLMLGIVHTGIAYVLYFGAVGKLPVQTSALLGYIDPITAVLLSALVLHEALTPSGVAGALLIIGALVVHSRE